MDNGDPSRDGWMFRGGGILQLIRRYNYTKFGEAVHMSFLKTQLTMSNKKRSIRSLVGFGILTISTNGVMLWML